MISESEILRRIYKERARFRRELGTPFIQGIRQGLVIAFDLVRETSRDARQVREEYRGKLNRWSAGKFYKAICAALGYLKRGERGRGIQILQAAIEHEGQVKSPARAAPIRSLL